MYRTDVLNCATFVEVVLALIHAHNLAQYEKNFISISYGAAHLLAKQPFSISYANRNNFVSGGFNLINQKRGLLTDTTGMGVFKPYIKYTTTTIDRAKWFSYLASPEKVKTTVRVLSNLAGVNMVKRLRSNYGSFFKPQRVKLGYLPKSILVKSYKAPGGHRVYQANQALINQVPVPSVVEIVRDFRKWQLGGVNIKKVIGTGINVSHLGLLYRQTFKPGQLIYHRIGCSFTKSNKKICSVEPIYCSKKPGCTETMMAAATNAYPDGYIYSYQAKTGRYFCSSMDDMPKGARALTTCNRVTVMPLGDYLAAYQYGHYIYMDRALFCL